MADYYLILKRAVSALPDSTREKRQAVYDKARAALINQLQNMDPPLAPSDISKQRVALEEAVRSVERDLSLETEADAKAAAEEAKPSEPTSPASGQAPEVAPVAPASPAPNTAPVSTVAPTPTAGIPKAPDVSVGQAPEVSAAAAPSAPVSPPPVKSPAAPVVSAQEAAKSVSSGQKAAEVAVPVSGQVVEDGPKNEDKLMRRAGQDVLKNAVRDAKALGSATNAAVKSAQETADIVGDGSDGNRPRIEPKLGDAVVSGSKTYTRSGDASSLAGSGPMMDEDSRKSSRLGLIVSLAIGAVVLGGSGYLLYKNKDTFIGQSGGAGEQVPEVAKSGENMAPKTVRTVTVTPDDGNSSSENGESDGINDLLKSQNQADADQATAQAGNGTTSQESVKPADISVAQRSILYEEGSEQGKGGTATSGEAVWTLEGAGKDSRILVRVNVADLNLGYSVSISLNQDQELPASHLIEIEAQQGDGPRARIIKEIPGLIMKPTEQSRGAGLVGAATKIADDLFWIALTAGEKEMKYNLEMLELRSWIDMPIMYENGRRAILTIEKGKPGDEVIKQALTAWGQAQ